MQTLKHAPFINFILEPLIRINLTNHILFQRRVTPVHFQALMMEKLRYKYYNKRITTHGISNVQSCDQEESKLNSTINRKKGANALTGVKIITALFLSKL